MVATLGGSAFACVNVFRRDLRIGEHVTVHLKDGTTVQGRLVKQSRRYFTLVEHKMQVGDALRELVSDRLLVPREGAKIEASRA